MKVGSGRKSIRSWLFIFSLVASCILFFFAVYRFDSFSLLVGRMTAILRPFVYGLVLAYLLCPLYNNIYIRVYDGFWKNVLKESGAVKTSKIISSFFSMLVLFIVVGGLLLLIIPGMVESIIAIANTLPENTQSTIKFVQEKFEHLPQIAGPFENIVNNSTDKFVKYVETDMLPRYDAIFTSVSMGVFGFIGTIINLFVGLIICVFFLNSKDMFTGQVRKLAFALFNEKRANKILRGAAFTNKTFGRFINGKLIDSLVVGIICFICMSAFGWPYAILISTIIGITNIIPFFGPFIGAVPATLLLFIEDPQISLYFILFILVLQQIDGNIIGPKILGGSTGLPSFWVMFAILVGGGLFGFVGMIVGIPIFAVVFAYTAYAVDGKLDEKGLSVDLEDYKNLYTKSIEDMDISIIKEK